MIFSNKNIPSEIVMPLIKLSYLGWFAYFIVFNLYSIFWRQFNTEVAYDYISTLVWFFKEWGFWIVITPLTLLLLDVLSKKLSVLLNIIFTGFGCLLLSIAVRIQLNSGEYPLEWMASTVIMLPKYVSAYLALAMVWYFKKQQAYKFITVKNLNEIDQPSIDVEHKGLCINLKCSQIYSIKSAGNYIEIESENVTYLKRGTLKESLDKLPTFVKVHRSYAINVDKITKLTNLENGGSIATMSNESNVPVSRRYKASLKSISLPAN